MGRGVRHEALTRSLQATDDYPAFRDSFIETDGIGFNARVTSGSFSE